MTEPSLMALIEAGDTPAVAHRVVAMTAAERNQHRDAVRRQWGHADWIEPGMRVSARQAACWAAYVGLGTRRDAMGTTPPADDDAFFVLALYRPAWLHDYLVARLPERFELARRMERAGLVSFPARPDAWTLGVMTLGNKPAAALLATLRDDPALLAEIPALFRTEGAGTLSMATLAQRGGGWAEALTVLSEAGTIAREPLLDDTLYALKAGFSNYHAAWYRDLHTRLAPRPSELLARRLDYLSLLGADAAPTVDLALGALERVHSLEPLAPDTVADAIAPAMLQRSKATALRAITFLLQALPPRTYTSEFTDDDVVWLRCVHKVADALGHPDEGVRTRWMEAFLDARLWQVPEQRRRELFEAWSARTPSADLPRLRERLHLPAEPVEPPAPAFVSVMETTPRLPTPLAIPDTAEAVRRAFEVALECPEDVLLVEAALAGAVLVGATPDEALADAVREYVQTMTDYPRNNATLLVALVAHAWATGGAGIHPRYLTPDEDPDDPFAIFAWSRMEAVAYHVHRGCRLPLLATPTHDDMTLDAVVFAKRIEAWAASGERPDRFDLALALARLAPGTHVDALALLVAAGERNGSWSFTSEGRLIPEFRANALRRFATWALGQDGRPNSYFAPSALMRAAFEAGDRLGAPPSRGYQHASVQLAPPAAGDMVRVPDEPFPAGQTSPALQPQLSLYDLRPRMVLRACHRACVWPYYLTWFGAACPHEPELLGALLFRWLRVTLDERSDEAFVPGLTLLGRLPGAFGAWGAHASVLALASNDDRVRTAAIGVLTDGLSTGRTTPADLGVALYRMLATQRAPARRFVEPLKDVAGASPGHARCVRDMLQGALTGPREGMHKHVHALIGAWSDLAEQVGTAPLTPGNLDLLRSFPPASAGGQAAARLLAQHAET